MSTLTEIQEEVARYLENVMPKKPAKILRPKAIHDSIHQTNFFLPYEVALIDLPIVQRLRRVSQTDVASYVYPSANHSRFEHTLGVTVLAGRFIEALWQKPSAIETLYNLHNSDKDYYSNHARVAAILHDVGHGPFSHLSEQLYAQNVKKISRAEPRLQGASPHEILSFCIATSNALRKFNTNVLSSDYGVTIDLDLVADIIVGNAKDHKEIAFLIEVVNGGFDADKLDYMLRDAHATGIQMSLDLSRLLYALNIYKDKNGAMRLSIDMRGALALEQIIFNKMTLTASVYHHHKVRAAGCILRELIKEVISAEPLGAYPQKTDDFIFTCGLTSRGEELKNCFQNRIIPKRALTISHKNIHPDHKGEFVKFMDLYGDFGAQEEIKKEIVEKVLSENYKNLTGKIWLDVPNTPKFKEAITTNITENGTEPITLKDLFPIDDWVNAYSQNKWKAYVFCSEEYVAEVAAASKYVFGELYQLKFD